MNAASCVQLIEAKLDEYGVSLTYDIVAQTTDGCSQMVALRKSIKSYHQLCIAHAVQMAIVDVMYKCNAGFEENVAQLVELDEDEDLPLSVLAQRLRTVEFNEDTNCTDNDNDGIEFNNESSFMESFSSQSFRYNDLLSKVRKVVKIFKKSPMKSAYILQKHVRADFGQEYSLLLDRKMRWSSISAMLEDKEILAEAKKRIQEAFKIELGSFPHIPKAGFSGSLSEVSRAAAPAAKHCHRVSHASEQRPVSRSEACPSP
ncbi:unnamed protein product, partial [Iphiclides podalirius]